MPRAGRATVNVTMLGCPAQFLPAGSSRNVAQARRQSFEDGIQTIERLFRAADHHAVAAFQTPDAAAGANVNVMDSSLFQFLRPPDVIFVIRVAAVNDDVACFKSL